MSPVSNPVVAVPEPIASIADRLAAAKRAICDHTIDECTHVLGDALGAIVLTGSLAREEATAVCNGMLHLLSDADFLLVIKSGAPHPCDATLATLAANVERSLSQEGIIAHIGLGAVGSAYFADLPPHSYTYELRHCGSAVWGDVRVLQRIPDYSREELSREDAWRTLNHRIIEALAKMADEPPNNEASPDLRYATIKLFLDAATSYLIFSGHYAPTYFLRAEQLRRLTAGNEADAPFDLRSFAAEVTRWTEWKLNRRPAGQPMSRRTMAAALTYAEQLWRWEAARLGSADTSLTPFQFVREVARTQSAAQRMRGWMSLLRRSAWLRSWRNWPQWLWLSRFGTPRYLLYAVAQELLEAAPLEAADQPRRSFDGQLLRRVLRVKVRHSDSAEAWRTSIKKLWQMYEQFLLRTLA
jgi:hypothetical protein